MIHTINHIGIGVQDIDHAYPFYRHFLNFLFNLNDDVADLWELAPMFGRTPRMRMKNAANPRGGPGLEFFEHRDSAPRVRTTQPRWSDIGLLELGVWVQGIQRLRQSMLADGIHPLTDIRPLLTTFGQIWQAVYLHSPDGILIQLVEKPDHANKRPQILGISHVGVGTADIEKSLTFYRDTLGFDKIVHQSQHDPHLLADIMPASALVEMMLLARSGGSTSRLSSFDGGMIKLIHCQETASARVFAGRRFGDPGLTEIGLEAADVDAAFETAVQQGAAPLVPPTDFDTGFGPRGALAYVADPDGVVIEFVRLKSVFKLPPLLLDWLTIRPLRLLAKLGVV